MVNVRTWFNKVTQKKTNRVAVRIQHNLALSGMADALCMYSFRYSDEDGLPATITPSALVRICRDMYSLYGTNAIWCWSDDWYGDGTPEELRQQAEEIIIRALPALAENRG